MTGLEEAIEEIRRLQLWIVALGVTVLCSLFVTWQLRSDLTSLEKDQTESMAYVMTLHLAMAKAGVSVPEPNTTTSKGDK